MKLVVMVTRKRKVTKLGSVRFDGRGLRGHSNRETEPCFQRASPLRGQGGRRAEGRAKGTREGGGALRDQPAGRCLQHRVRRQGEDGSRTFKSCGCGRRVTNRSRGRGTQAVPNQEAAGREPGLCIPHPFLLPPSSSAALLWSHGPQTRGQGLEVSLQANRDPERCTETLGTLGSGHRARPVATPFSFTARAAPTVLRTVSVEPESCLHPRYLPVLSTEPGLSPAPRLRDLAHVYGLAARVAHVRMRSPPLQTTGVTGHSPPPFSLEFGVRQLLNKWGTNVSVSQLLCSHLLEFGSRLGSLQARFAPKTPLPVFRSMLEKCPLSCRFC